MSFNMLATQYTKFNTALHGGATPGCKETAAQRDARYAMNQDRLAHLDADVLLLQEHDVACALPPEYQGYGVHATVERREEGCSVAFSSKDAGALPVCACYRTLDLGEGKTAAIARTPGLTYVSVHLKGGPGSVPIRNEQVRWLLANVPAACGGDPVLIAGDMNEAAPDEPVTGSSEPSLSALFASQGFRRIPYAGYSGLNGGMTVPLAIDHVYVRGMDDVDVRVTLPYQPACPWAPEARVGSDHVPLVISLTPRT